MRSLNVGEKIPSYTGVIIHVGQNSSGDEVTFPAGNNSGYVLEVDNPLGTQEMAYAILAGLKLRGISYQPFDAESAILDPSAEIGDNITVNGVDSVIMSTATKHSRLMAADVSAPMDEELDHEFKYEPKTVREFKRESSYTRSRLTIAQDEIRAEVVRATGSEATLSAALSVQADRITSEVTRATAAEGNLSSRITQTADAITAEVTRATGAEGTLSTRIDQRLDSITLSVSSSAGSSTFTLKDGSATLDTQTLDLSVKSVNISGKLTASQIDVTDLNAFGATIGGWTINATNIEKNIAGSYYVRLSAPSSPASNTAAIGVRDLANDRWMFYVTYGGSVYARNATIEGKITATSGVIGGLSIDANGVLKGISDTNVALHGISGANGDGAIALDTITTSNTTSGINTNLGWGASYGMAVNGTTYADDYYVTNLRATRVYANTYLYAASFQYGSTVLSLQTKTISGVTIHYLGY